MKTDMVREKILELTLLIKEIFRIEQQAILNRGKMMKPYLSILSE